MAQARGGPRRERRHRGDVPISTRRDKTRHATAPAFTLVELLVVIAILALLVSLLAPFLTQARELGRLTVCQAHFRNAGQGFLGFAATHEGRFPNMGTSRLEYNSPPWPPTWQNILNREYFHGNDNAYYPAQGDYYSRFRDEPTCGPIIRFWTFWHPDEYKPQWLKDRYYICPSYIAWGAYPGAASNIWSRACIMNSYAAGGGYGSSEAAGGKRLTSVEAGAVHAAYADPDYGSYWLGTKMSAINNPSSKYLAFDSEAGSDYTSGLSTGPVPVNVDPGKAPWCSAYGTWAFRHMRPPDVGLYQQKVRGAAVYADGHAGVVNPNDPIDTAAHFQPDP